MPEKMHCWFCNEEMIWGADFDFSDYGIEGSGIVATFSCTGCGATADFYTSQEDTDENSTEAAQR